MARAELHKLILELGGPVSTWSSSFSGGMTLMAPASGKKLQIFHLETAGDTETQVRFHRGDTAFWTAFFGANAHRGLPLNGRYVEIPDGSSLRVTRPSGNESVDVTVLYREVDTNHIS